MFVVEQVCEICGVCNEHFTRDCLGFPEMDSVILAPNGELVPTYGGIGTDGRDPDGRDCWGCVTCGNTQCGWIPDQECDTHVHALSERHMNAAKYSSIRRMARAHHRVMVAAAGKSRLDDAHLRVLDSLYVVDAG